MARGRIGTFRSYSSSACAAPVWLRYWGLARVNQLSSDREPRRMATRQVTVRHCSLVSRAAAPRPAWNEYSFHLVEKSGLQRGVYAGQNGCAARDLNPEPAD
jgi:hypothetical protein